MEQVNTQPAPVAVFAYRRVDKLRKLMESLQQCHDVRDHKIIVFVDGAKGNEDKDSVKSVRTYLASLGWNNLEVIASEHNKGLRKSISDGVSAITQKYGRVIVLEDDLILSPLALSYFNAALNKFADNTDVWSVCGYMYDVPDLRQRDAAFALPFVHPWGWATWDRAWSQFRLDDPQPPPLFGSPSFQKAFNAPGAANYSTMLKLTLEGKYNSWFIQWYYRVFVARGVSIFPPVTYILNDGIGGADATHGTRLNPHRFLVRKQKLADNLVALPDIAIVDYPALDSLGLSWDARVHRLIDFLGAVKRKFR